MISKGICKGDFSTAKSSDQSAHKLKSENKIFRTTEPTEYLGCTVGYFSRNQLNQKILNLNFESIYEHTVIQIL